MFTRRKLLIKRIDDAFVYLQIGQLGTKIKSDAVRISWLRGLRGLPVYLFESDQRVVGRSCGLGSNLFNFFTQLKLEGGIFFHAIGE
jgi:hypothetical protein